MNYDATILFPFGGGDRYGRLAISSLQRYSVLPLGLTIAVEPMATAEERAWVKTIPSLWNGNVNIIWNMTRRGYYGTVNEMARNCPTPIGIIFTNDQVASPNWDVELLKVLKPNRFVTGRLVESGASLIADGTIWRRFGYNPEVFNEKKFIDFCKNYNPVQNIDVPRHYIPMAFYVDDFRRAGMFEEGKDTMSVSTFREDLHFFLRALKQGFEIVEAQKALTYHFQHGSKRTTSLFRRHLNWIYPFGLKHVHRMVTGYVSLYDSMISNGSAELISRIRREESP